MTGAPPRTVAAFDFDGTLSRRDTLVPFLVRAAGRRRFVAVASRLGVTSPGGLRDRDGTKERLLAALFAGMDDQHLRALGRQHARDVLTSGLRPAVLDRLHRHRHLGHEVVFVSASLVHYLEPIAEELGVQAVLAVEPEVVDGRLTGALVRPNVRAAQKAVRLREWLGAPAVGPLRDVELWAYGNSSGDHQLLALADHAQWLGSPARRPAGVEQFPGRVPG
jgi:phosphatidylglycerophosphatase C